MIDHKQPRRTVGFIRANSGKNLPTFKVSNEHSSDDFSSFEGEDIQNDSDREFSPYRYESRNQIKQNTYESSASKMVNNKVLFSNEKLRKNYMGQSPNSGKIVDTKENIIRQNLKKRAQISRQLQEMKKSYQNNQSSVRNFDKNIQSPMMTLNQVRNSHDSLHSSHPYKAKSIQQIHNKYNFPTKQRPIEKNPQKDIVLNKITFGMTKRSNQPIQNDEQFSQSSVSAKEEESQSFFFTSFNKNTKSSAKKQKYYAFPLYRKDQGMNQNTFGKSNKKNVYVQHQDYSSSQEDDKNQRLQSNEDEELITEYPLTSLNKNDGNFKRNQYRQSSSNKKTMHQTKGGVCFDLDVNQFTHFDSKNNVRKNPPVRKNKKVNEKQELLRRRQMARKYDKQARAKVFGNM